ncbi:MAG: nucleoside 2-deoxyribosyltransferase, partial [Alphaproteobacteria bacterium]|nr:nucleoside 2-deoxyribosyltransferase [Alphaproteobacteria bacterium]
MKLVVVGGLYVERCVQPLWDAVFGSGGRAAAAVSALVPTTVLATYVPNAISADAEALAAMFGFELRPHPASRPVAFDYLHPLATPFITPPPDRIAIQSPIQIDSELVLRFGMLEGDAVVRADAAVYDPQSAFGAKRFSENGSTAGHLAVVLNRSEAVSMTGARDPEQAAEWLMREEGAEVVVVKMGSQGAFVATRDMAVVIPLYRSDLVW